LQTAALAVWALVPVACQQQMAAQPAYRPLDPSSFFADGRSARPLVPGTVARGHLRTDLHLYTGQRRPEGAAWFAAAAQSGAAAAGPLGALSLEAERQANLVDEFPFPVTEQVLKHGQNRYMIYCVVCHDPLGTGRGMIVQRGYTPPPSYHIERLRKAPVGHFFQVVTLGYGSMPSYRAQVPPRDRWAIIAYIRALQLSQQFPEGRLAPEERDRVAKAGGQPR
jgi:mono/diheme cytochrome c family protein